MDFITNKDIFNFCKEELSSSDETFGILDYALGPELSEIVDIKTNYFVPYTKTAYGGSEGIYTDVYIEIYPQQYKKDTTEDIIHIGTMKTLYDDKESYLKMHRLAAEFELAIIKFRNEHYDELQRTDITAVYYSYPRIESILRSGKNVTLSDIDAMSEEELLLVYDKKVCLQIQTTDEGGVDYTLMNLGLAEIDGGQIDAGEDEDELSLSEGIRDVLTDYYSIDEIDESKLSLVDLMEVLDIRDSSTPTKSGSLIIEYSKFNMEKMVSQQKYLKESPYVKIELVDNASKTAIYEIYINRIEKL